MSKSGWREQPEGKAERGRDPVDKLSGIAYYSQTCRMVAGCDSCHFSTPAATVLFLPGDENALHGMRR
jgi:hypothetical protein